MAEAIELRVEVAGEVQLRRRIDGIARNTADLGPALERIADSFFRHVAEVFATEGGATASGHWKPLSSRYGAWKAKHYPGKPLLVLSGAMERALTGRGAGSIRRIDGQGLTMGASIRTPNGRWDLALIHQMGRRDGSIPARRMLDFPESVKSEWMRYIRDHVWGE